MDFVQVQLLGLSFREIVVGNQVEGHLASPGVLEFLEESALIRLHGEVAAMLQPGEPSQCIETKVSGPEELT